MGTKKYAIMSAVLSSFTLGISGYVPLSVAAIACNSAKTSEQRRELARDFHTNNTLWREAGLSPFDLCTEKCEFDKYLARQDPECKEKFKEFDKEVRAYTSKEAEQLQGVIETRLGGTENEIFKGLTH